MKGGHKYREKMGREGASNADNFILPPLRRGKQSCSKQSVPFEGYQWIVVYSRMQGKRDAIRTFISVNRIERLRAGLEYEPPQRSVKMQTESRKQENRFLHRFAKTLRANFTHFEGKTLSLRRRMLTTLAFLIPAFLQVFFERKLKDRDFLSSCAENSL